MFFEQYDHEPNIAVARFWLKYAPSPEKYADALPGAATRAATSALAAME